jgi:3-oxoacyl-[acyl-carrier protein] reductase
MTKLTAGSRSIDGRVAIVTGAASGMGRATAHLFAGEGAKVAVVDLGQERVQAVVDEIADAGGVARGWVLDVSDHASVEQIVREIREALGPIDILVNNAGIAKDQLMLRMKREDWDAVIATNLTAAFLLTQAVLKPMIRQKSGRIVCISSVVGQRGNAGQANYAASKAGLIGFAKAVAQEVASRNITVNVVAPGLIETDMTRGLTGDAREAWASTIPLKRLGTPDDIAAAVCFLASPEASYITGQVLAVNGGMYM